MIDIKTFPIQLPSNWRHCTIRFVLGVTIFISGVSFFPYHWCVRDADEWYAGDVKRQLTLARGVEYWISRELSRDDFNTGSRQYNGEWLFGTYLMAGIGFAQSSLEHPELKERHSILVTNCIDRLLSAEVRAFDKEVWGDDPLLTLDGPRNHAAYLGYLNVLLGLHRCLEAKSPYADLNDRITRALIRRMDAAPMGLLMSYPNECYPVDNCAVIASIALHARATGADHGDRLRKCFRRLKDTCTEPKTGLLYQAVHYQTGEFMDHPRGSGTSLGLYFLAYADHGLSRVYYETTKKELISTVFGFGGAREYPRDIQNGRGDIDSGLVVFGYGLSPTGFLIGGSRIHGDREVFRRLFATAYAVGAPVERNGALHFVTGGALGDAILFAMLTAGPERGEKRP